MHRSWGSAASGLAYRRRDLAENERLYNHHQKRKSVTQFFLILVSLTPGVHNGWKSADAVEGTFGKMKVFTCNREWEGNFFEEKEVTVYYKYKGDQFVLLTVKARYGKNFNKRGDR